MMRDWKLVLLLLSLTVNVIILNLKIPHSSQRMTNRQRFIAETKEIEPELQLNKTANVLAVQECERELQSLQTKKDNEVQACEQELQSLRTAKSELTLGRALPNQELQLPKTGKIETTQTNPSDLMTDREQECERWMGLGIVSEYLKNAAEWCVGQPHLPNQGRLRCFTVKYPWDHHGKGAFCEGFNVTVDFGQIQTGPIKDKAHLTYKADAMHMSCNKTREWAESKLMPQQKQMLSMMALGKDPRRKADEVVTKSTYIVARHEDVNNMYHSIGDWTNMEVVYRALGIAPEVVQVVLWDRFKPMWHHQVLQPAFSLSNISDASSFGARAVLFRHLIWHLEAPANIIHPSKNVPFSQGRHVSCVGSSLMRAYTSRLLRAANLFHVPPPPIPHILLSLRIPKHKNAGGQFIGRVMANQKEVEDVFKEGNMLTWKSVDMANLTFFEQMAEVRRANILVGIHGAGLTWVVFTADEAVLVEIHPSYRLDRHFRHLAKLGGKYYMPLREKDSISCVGTSDRIAVNIDKLRCAPWPPLASRRKGAGALPLLWLSTHGWTCATACATAPVALEALLPPSPCKAL